MNIQISDILSVFLMIVSKPAQDLNHLKGERWIPIVLRTPLPSLPQQALDQEPVQLEGLCQGVNRLILMAFQKHISSQSDAQNQVYRL